MSTVNANCNIIVFVNKIVTKFYEIRCLFFRWTFFMSENKYICKIYKYICKINLIQTKSSQLTHDNVVCNI